MSSRSLVAMPDRSITAPTAMRASSNASTSTSEPFRARPMARLGRPHLLVAGRGAVPGLAVTLAAVAGPADREEAQALAAPLEAESVVVVVHDALHEDFTIRGLEAGKFVLCTKPKASSMEAALNIARVARAHPGHYMLSLQMGYSPLVTTIRKLIAEGRPIPSGEGEDPASPDFVRMVEGRWELIPGHNRIGRPAREGDLFTAMTGDGGGFGDPIERDPELVRRDLENQVTTPWTARHVYCVAIDLESLEVNKPETERLRQARREERKRTALPAQEYKARQREVLLRGDLAKPTARMYHAVLGSSGAFRRAFAEFWELPEGWEMTDPDGEAEEVA